MYALDNNPVAVDYVNRKITREEMKNVHVVLAGADRTGLPSESLDTVFLFGVIHALWHGIDQITVEIHRVQKVQGVLSISKSRVPEVQLVDAVTTNGMFRLKQEADRVLNFEKLAMGGLPPPLPPMK